MFRPKLRTPFRTNAENLSGCAFCLGRSRGGDLVAFHANTHTKSTREDKRGKAINWQHPDALANLGALVNTAKVDMGIKTMEYYCGKDKYLKAAANAFGHQEFAGGTTIAGFHHGTLAGKWSFWYQTFGTTDRNGDYSMIESRKFWQEP